MQSSVGIQGCAGLVFHFACVLGVWGGGSWDFTIWGDLRAKRDKRYSKCGFGGVNVFLLKIVCFYFCIFRVL